jgi:hypothetical protein
MNQIKGLSRHLVTFGSLEENASGENPIRLLDAFLDKLDLNQLGFIQRELKSEGRPGFENETVLKIYLYGYVNGMKHLPDWQEIDRSEYAQAVEENAERYKNNKELYRKRQEINEHIFGTIKRKWSYYYTDLRGLEKVNGEHSFICLVYNLVRAINIISVPKILENINNWTPNYRAIVRYVTFLLYSDRFRAIKI